MASDLPVARNIDTLIGAIAIAAAVGIGVVLSGNADTSSEGNDLVTIIQGLYGAYANLSYVYPPTINSAVLTNAGKIDKTLISGTSAAPVINSRYNTPIVLGSSGGNPTASMTGIPFNACADLATNSTLAPYVVSITVGGSTLAPPVDPGAAATACGNTGPVNMTITYNPRP